MTVRIVSDHNAMERFVGHKLDDADTSFQLMKDQGSDVTSFLTQGKQWQAVTVSASNLTGLASVLKR